MSDINLEKIKSLLEKGDIDKQIEAHLELGNWLIEKLNDVKKDADEKLKKLNGI